MEQSDPAESLPERFKRLNWNVAETRVYISKAKWGDGPWGQEPDCVAWWDAHSGYPCALLRHPLQGHWRGYIGIPPSHRLFGYDASHFQQMQVHGAVTFCNHSLPPDAQLKQEVRGTLVTTTDEAQKAVKSGQAHAPPSPMHTPNTFWVGVDFGHGGIDHLPGLGAIGGDSTIPHPVRAGEPYRGLEYARNQVEHLARQLKAQAAVPR